MNYLIANEVNENIFFLTCLNNSKHSWGTLLPPVDFAKESR